jgi:single-strand DNA-binding protein
MSEVQGKIHRIGATQTVGNNGFTKRELVVVTEGQYPQYIALEFHKDKCSLLDGRKVGEQVHAYYNLNGRLWTSPKGEERCFNTLACWKMTALGAASPAPSGQVPDAEGSDLPF